MQYMEEKGALLIWTLCSCTLLMMLVLNNLYISDVFLSNVWINLSQTHTILGVASTCSPLDWRHHLITCTHHAVSQSVLQILLTCVSTQRCSDSSTEKYAVEKLNDAVLRTCSPGGRIWRLLDIISFIFRFRHMLHPLIAVSSGW